ncbi:hypothetical protein DNH61_25560 [Paenibacillus sambharensis]|uniref:Aminotransferase class I/classII domain-containing protein n=1 Tax=Paenibacillus sambharensis TaxID=1803190 RepID=A0A2W1L256_9BACL|nr:hypothetical protein DNH61_25560 [Paenibacillus sambharensis]
MYVVEDDYMADLDEDRKSDPLFAYGHSGKIIYLKSFSKIIFPGLRVGAAVVPDSLVETFCRYKRTLDIDTSMLSQGALDTGQKDFTVARAEPAAEAFGAGGRDRQALSAGVSPVRHAEAECDKRTFIRY